MDIDKSLHTVLLDKDKCKGCIACMKRCPTEAIRVRNGKAKVLYERCIGCAECVRMCPHQAKLPSYDSFDVINNYKYKIALPAPSLFGQFNNLEDINYVLNGLLKIGFDDVYEVANGAELVSDVSRRIIAEGNLKKPIISSACPAVVELILMEFHDLKDNILELQAPVDISAKLARERAIKKGIPAEDIGVFFISPCPAKVMALKMGMGVSKPTVDGVLSISEIYFKLVPVMANLTDLKPLANTGFLGVRWASSGGESIGLDTDKFLAADGIENVVNVLREMENGKLVDVDFVELNACVSGCVGGVLNIENPFVARSRSRILHRNLPEYRNTFEQVDKPLDYFRWEVSPELKQPFLLDENRMVAMRKMDEIERIYETLPHLDCGSCGAPSCRAFAEDVVNGNGEITVDMCVRKEKQ